MNDGMKAAIDFDQTIVPVVALLLIPTSGFLNELIQLFQLIGLDAYGCQLARQTLKLYFDLKRIANFLNINRCHMGTEAWNNIDQFQVHQLL